MSATIADIRQRVAEWRRAGERVALIPTMGALHAGHLSLIEVGRKHCQRCVASIFVNPLQFGPKEDFNFYPRTLESDLEQLAEAGTDLAFVPAVEEIYPYMNVQGGTLTTVTVRGIADSMEGKERPGHFDGVATVVAKLLLICQPDIAIFGEKDYQQLQVIKRMVLDLNIPVNILGAATVREADGLALSSRNAYLSEPERKIAAHLYRVISSIAEKIRSAPDSVAAALALGKIELSAAGFDSVDYLDLRDSSNLEAMNRLDRPGRLLAAARLGAVRLIDNIAVTG